MREGLFRFVYKHEIWHRYSLGHTEYIFRAPKPALTRAAILAKSKMDGTGTVSVFLDSKTSKNTTASAKSVS